MKKGDKPVIAAADLALPVNCISSALGRAQRAAYRRYETALKSSQVTPTQFGILTTLSVVGETAISSLAKTMGTDRTTLTRNLVPLVRRGLVEDRRGKDGRVRLLGLTPDGRKTQAAAVRLWQDAQAKFIAHLGTDNAVILFERLNAIS